jgi:hypothetical protein
MATSRASDHGDAERLLGTRAHPLRDLIDELRRIIRGVGPDVTESVKWNAPSFAISDHFATLQVRDPSVVRVVLHRGARPKTRLALRPLIEDPERILEWRGPDRALLTFRTVEEARDREAAFRDVLRQWVTHTA